MKYIKLLLIIILTVIVLPFNTFADDSKDEVNVYFFRGDGCPHCEEAEEFFKSIEEEYGSYFKINDYETWYNEDNQKLMEKVAKARDEEAEGVPYIIIGNKSWNGYSTDYNDNIIKKITEEYKKDVNDRYDIMKIVNSKSSDKEDYTKDIISLILIVIITGSIVTGIYFTRKKTS